MKISIDGGGIPSKTGTAFGNAVFVDNFLKALTSVDRINRYFIYTFRDSQHIVNQKNFIFQNLRPSMGWMKVRVPFEEIMHKKKYFLAINQAVPEFTPAEIITFSHGLSFFYFKELYKDYAKLKKQLDVYISKSKYIVTSSKRVKNELIQLGVVKNRLIVNPFGIPFDFQTTKVQKREQFFLFTGMNHSIKNIPYLIDVFKQLLLTKEYSEFKMYLCGPFDEYGDVPFIKVFSTISRRKLKDLYQKATGYISASFYESFNFPILEALSQNCPVIALQSAVIPELEEYTQVVKNKSEFLNSMKLCINNKTKKINQRSLKADFSWNKYVNTVIKLYNK